MLEVADSYPWWKIPILLVIFPDVWWKSTIFTMVSPWWNTHHIPSPSPSASGLSLFHLGAAYYDTTCILYIIWIYIYIYIYCTILVYYIYIYILLCIYIYIYYVYLYVYIYIQIFIVQLLRMAQMAIGAFRRCIPQLHLEWNMYPLVSSGWWLSHLRKQGSQLGTVISQQHIWRRYLFDWDRTQKL